MAIPKRNANPNAIIADSRTFFVTTATLGRRRLLQSVRMARLVIDVLYEYRAQSKYGLHEFVIMPNHIHLLLSVGSTVSIEEAVQFVKGGSAIRAGKRYGLPYPWQRGFSEVRITSESEYSARRTYIHLNPVRAGLVTLPEQYEYSSSFPSYELDAVPFGLGFAQTARLKSCPDTIQDNRNA